MRWLINLFDKTGSIGVIAATMGCASCFPAVGSLGAVLGLGFLHQYEGIFINTLLPIFAAIALVANAFIFYKHKKWLRGLLGIAGPIMVLLTMYPLWTYNWSTYLLYSGIVLMLFISVWNLFWPENITCPQRESAI